MPDSIRNISELIAGKFLGTLTIEQELELETWEQSSDTNRKLLAELMDKQKLHQKLGYYSEAEAIKREVGEVLFKPSPTLIEEAPVISIPRQSFLPYWLRYAAVVIIIGAMGTYLWLQNNESLTSVSESRQLALAIPPGTEGAILTLADGSQVVLDSLSDGLIATQNGSQVMLENGQIAYTASDKQTAKTVYNTMSTPKGRQYPLILPDGTKVWLNAASSIRYPTVFSGKERRVTITGEVYFEVAQNAITPFHVNVRDGASITVLGTQFNVNAYENESRIKATLIEGSIRVAVLASDPSQKAEHVVLLPGQQAQITPIVAGNGIKVIANADVEKELAWKNGLFDFNGLAFEEIMRQLERWYDIQVVYENNQAPNKRLVGKMTRDVPLHGLLKNLEELGVRYKLHNRTLTISP